MRPFLAILVDTSVPMRTLALLLVSAVLLAQSNVGELRVKITDQAGLPIPCTVEVVSQANEVRQKLDTDAAGTLADDAVTRGRSADETVTSVETFTGSAFHAPVAARPIIVLPKGYMSHQCILPCPAGVPEHSVAGFLQGAVMDFGQGRVAVFGEAAMFTAQEVTGQKPALHFGFTAPTAKQNKQFILNLANWLAGSLGD